MNDDALPAVSVIIPTLNAEKDIARLLDSLLQQTVPIEEIIVVDSASEDRTVSIVQQFEKVKLIRIKREEFDHGRTRDMALQKSAGDIVVFMTQDAVPTDGSFLFNLIKPLDQEKVAVSAGRQLPKADASPVEKLVRTYNYPEKSHIRSKEDIPQMGIKTFFCSDVCAAYDREIYQETGGFEYPLKTNEDMFFAAKAINAGYRIAYAADALVFHSHNFTLKEQYQRNYIQGYEIERHRDILCNVTPKAEGKKMVRFVSSELLKHGQIISFVRFILDCGARYIGSELGRSAAKKRERALSDRP